METDPSAIESGLVTGYEEASGRTLADGDPVRLFLLSVAAAIIQLRNAVNVAAQQNLLSYATGKYLDELGRYLAVTRLPASGAKTTFRFALGRAGRSLCHSCRVRGNQRRDNFRHGCGSSHQPRRAFCGCRRHLYHTGRSRKRVSGRTDSDYRISKALSGFSGQFDRNLGRCRGRGRRGVCGTYSSGPQQFFRGRAVEGLHFPYLQREFRHHRRGGHVAHARRGQRLSAAGRPGEELLGDVEAYLSSEDIRPLTDEVHTLAPTAKNYAIKVDYWIFSEDQSRAEQIKAEVQAAVEEYRLWQQGRIGRDILPDQLIRSVIAAGAARVDSSTLSPATFIELEEDEVAQCTGVTVNFKGYKAL